MLMTNSKLIATEIMLHPTPCEKCFHGLAGDFVNLVEPYTEADRMALLIQFLTAFGAIIGRSAYFQIESTRHYTNLFTVLVGGTATGRKGTSLGRVKAVFEGIDEQFEQNCIVAGLASGEGLIYHVRDASERTRTKGGRFETVVDDAGVLDKRLLINEGEFAQVLSVQGREGNTLSTVIRNLWDDGNARNLTKNSPVKTSNAHVAIIGHITKTELLNCLKRVESANGYANRFLWVCVERSKYLPFGGDVPTKELDKLRERLRSSVSFAKAVERMQFNDEAAKIWASEYERLETSRKGFLAKITQRASPYVLRLSCLFALLDQQVSINREHLEAALAVWQYCEDSARFVFGNSTGDKLADEVLSLLMDKSESGLTKTEIINLTRKNALQLNSALDLLYEQKLARFQKETQPDTRKPTMRWFVTEN
jgi:Protein of unknown function (DUF3987)